MDLVCPKLKSTSANKKKPMNIIELPTPISKIMIGRAAVPWERFSSVFTLPSSTSLRISKIGSYVSVAHEGMC